MLRAQSNVIVCVWEVRVRVCVWGGVTHHCALLVSALQRQHLEEAARQPMTEGRAGACV